MGKEVRLSDLGFVRVAAAIPELRVADVDFNITKTIECMNEGSAKGAQILVLPELGITGYTCQDLFFQKTLLDKAEKGLWKILRVSAKDEGMMVVVGMPVRVPGVPKPFNCAVVVHRGIILGVVPKTYLPNDREFYEKRWFGSGYDARISQVKLCGQTSPFGTEILFRAANIPDVKVGVEICEDFWVPLAPHEYQAYAGATILVNLSASNEVIGKAKWRKIMVASESGRCYAAYVYVSAGPGESANDLVFGGHAIIGENGAILKESQRFLRSSQVVVQDIDMVRITHDRRVSTSFSDGVHASEKEFQNIDCTLFDPTADRIERFIDPHPFVPSDLSMRNERCEEIVSMLVSALATKIESAKTKQVLLAISGGSDSTLVALIVAKTLDLLGISRKNAHVVTMPGFGTTKRTKGNALTLGELLGFTVYNIPIRKSVAQHLKDIGHDLYDEDVVFQNAQARYRTEILFNMGNRIPSLVVGTGDLSEAALGWCTFSGDHISHYHVIAGMPKTLVKYVIRWFADTQADPKTKTCLESILATIVSPELVRSKTGKVEQNSEDVVGPYELNDFYLYEFIRTGSTPLRILMLAYAADLRGLFEGHYTLDELRKWLINFVGMFFKNQFKRTCMPEGPKIGSVSLSPRGDWRMSSDADPKVWIEDIEEAYAMISEKSAKEAQWKKDSSSM